ncbi:hypothetical protein HK102_010630, partial [Quaeritorhiza haematococci]
MRNGERPGSQSHEPYIPPSASYPAAYRPPRHQYPPQQHYQYPRPLYGMSAPALHVIEDPAISHSVASVSGSPPIIHIEDDDDEEYDDESVLSPYSGTHSLGEKRGSEQNVDNASVGAKRKRDDEDDDASCSEGHAAQKRKESSSPTPKAGTTPTATAPPPTHEAQNEPDHDNDSASSDHFDEDYDDFLSESSSEDEPPEDGEYGVPTTQKRRVASAPSRGSSGAASSRGRGRGSSRGERATRKRRLNYNEDDEDEDDFDYADEEDEVEDGSGVWDGDENEEEDDDPVVGISRKLWRYLFLYFQLVGMSGLNDEDKDQDKKMEKELPAEPGQVAEAVVAHAIVDEEVEVVVAVAVPHPTTPSEPTSGPTFATILPHNSLTTASGPSAASTLASISAGYSHAASIEAGSVFCCICAQSDSPPSNRIVLCDGCDSPFHQKCHDPVVPDAVTLELHAPWFCWRCEGIGVAQRERVRRLSMQQDEQTNTQGEGQGEGQQVGAATAIVTDPSSSSSAAVPESHPSKRRGRPPKNSSWTIDASFEAPSAEGNSDRRGSHDVLSGRFMGHAGGTIVRDAGEGVERCVVCGTLKRGGQGDSMKFDSGGGVGEQAVKPNGVKIEGGPSVGSANGVEGMMKRCPVPENPAEVAKIMLEKMCSVCEEEFQTKYVYISTLPHATLVSLVFQASIQHRGLADLLGNREILSPPLSAQELLSFSAKPKPFVPTALMMLKAHNIFNGGGGGANGATSSAGAAGSVPVPAAGVSVAPGVPTASSSNAPVVPTGLGDAGGSGSGYMSGGEMGGSSAGSISQMDVSGKGKQPLVDHRVSSNSNIALTAQAFMTAGFPQTSTISPLNDASSNVTVATPTPTHTIGPVLAPAPPSVPTGSAVPVHRSPGLPAAQRPPATPQVPVASPTPVPLAPTPATPVPVAPSPVQIAPCPSAIPSSSPAMGQTPHVERVGVGIGSSTIKRSDSTLSITKTPGPSNPTSGYASPIPVSTASTS